MASALEHELVRRLAGLRFDPPARLHVQSLLHEAHSWHPVLEMIGIHGVGPLALANIETLEAPVPHQVLRTLRLQSQTNDRIVRFWEEKLPPLIGLFRKQGLRVLPERALGLAIAAYPDPSMRRIQSADVALPAYDVGAAVELLEERGWRSLTISAVRVEMYPDEGTQPLVMHAADERRDALSFDSSYERARPASLGLFRMLSPSPTDLLADHAQRALTHRWKQLRWVVDVDALCRAQPGVDWALLRAAMHANPPLRRALTLALRLSQTIYRSPLPVDIATYCREYVSTELLAASLSNLEQGAARGVVHRMKYDIAAAGGWLSRLRRWAG